MTITLNHTIIPSRDKQAAARLFSQLFGLSFADVKRSLRTSARERNPDTAF